MLALAFKYILAELFKLVKRKTFSIQNILFLLVRLGIF